jgi:hypothetical protein
MRLALVTIVATGCIASEPSTPAPLPPIDAVWGASIHAGDLMVLAPGTGSFDFLAAPIQALGGTHPIVDVRQNPTVAGDAVVFEQAIAAAHRAGFTVADLQAAALEFGLWGAGFTTVDGFDYVSYEGITLDITVLGGENSCATGSIFGDLLKYNTTDANTDANDLYARIQAYLVANPSSTGASRNVIIASHSWGGAVAEYMAENLSTYEAAIGPLADTGGTATLEFTIADGVPAFILDMALEGPGLRSVSGEQVLEIDRPDDPVHAMDPSGNGGGHQYTIVWGDMSTGTFKGSYGITTTLMDCDGVPGACTP